MIGGVRLVILLDSSQVFRLEAAQLNADHYQIPSRETTIRVNIRGTIDEIGLLRNIDICDVIASGLYSLGISYMSGVIAPVTCGVPVAISSRNNW